MAESLCPSCANSIRCDTWAEWRCKKYEKRIYNYTAITKCKLYSKRPKNFKEPKCQCEDCLKNELLLTEEYDEKEN